MRLAPIVLAALAISGHPSWAEAVVATKTIRPGSVLSLTNVALDADADNAGVDDLSVVLGQEAKTTLFAGRPVQKGDFGPPAVIERNALVELAFIHNGLTILVEGRALGRGAPGDVVRVMNLASRRTVMGEILSSGQVLVSVPGGIR